MTDTNEPQPGDRIEVSFEETVPLSGEYTCQHWDGVKVRVLEKAQRQFKVGDIYKSPAGNVWVRNNEGEWHCVNAGWREEKDDDWVRSWLNMRGGSIVGNVIADHRDTPKLDALVNTTTPFRIGADAVVGVTDPLRDKIAKFVAFQAVSRDVARAQSRDYDRSAGIREHAHLLAEWRQNIIGELTKILKETA